MATRVEQLLLQGVIQARVHDMTGADRKKIRSIAQALGLKTDSRVRCHHHEAQIRKMFDDGASFRTIGLSVGITKDPIAKFIRAKGWTR